MLVFSEDYVIHDHKYVCEPHAEYSNPFGMNTKLGGVKHTVSFLNSRIRVVKKTTSFPSTRITVVKHTVSFLNRRISVVKKTTSFPSTRITVVKHSVSFLNTRISVLEHTAKILNTHISSPKHAVSCLNTLCVLYFVDHASRYKFLEITNLTHFFTDLFISCLSMFRASQRSSSGD